MRNGSFSLLLVLSASSLVACGDKDDDSATYDEEACEHMVEGPTTALVATPDINIAETIEGEHRRFNIAFGSYGNAQGGWVYYPSEGGDTTFFLNKDIPFRVHDDHPYLLEAASSEKPFAACEEVAVSYTYALPFGTAILEFGPTAETSVFLVAEAGAHVE